MRARLLLATALAALLSCRRDAGPVTIGLIFPGPRSAEFISRHADTFRTRDGRPVRFVFDTTPPPSGLGFSAVQVAYASRLMERGDLAGMVFHQGSRESLLLAPMFREAQVPLLLTSATSRRLHATGPWTFMLAPDDSVEGAFIGNFVAERLGARSVTLFYVVDEYGTGLRDGVTSALRARGVSVRDAVPIQAAVECTPPSPNPYGHTVDASLRQGVPEVFVLAARQVESGCIIHRLVQRGAIRPVVAGDGLAPNGAFLRLAAGAGPLYRAAFWDPAVPDSVSRAFVQDYTRAMGRPPTPEDAMTYDGIMTLLAAIREAGAGHHAVRDWLASLGRTHPALPGVTGPITFPATAHRILMTRVTADRTVPVP